MQVINNVKLYTAKELSLMFGVSYATMLKYLRNGSIRKTRIGRTTYASEESLLDFLNGRTTATAGNNSEQAGK